MLSFDRRARDPRPHPLPRLNSLARRRISSCRAPSDTRSTYSVFRWSRSQDPEDQHLVGFRSPRRRTNPDSVRMYRRLQADNEQGPPTCDDRSYTVTTADITRQWSDSGSVALIGDPRLADAGLMSEQIVCTECGSTSLISSGVFEHGTWIHRLTCWTCRDCRTIFAVPEAESPALDAEAAGAPLQS